MPTDQNRPSAALTPGQILYLQNLQIRRFALFYAIAKAKSEYLDLLALTYFYGARYLDPRTSTWVSPDDRFDKLRKSHGLNIYSYVHNNPIRYNDPDGRELMAPNLDAAAGDYLEGLIQSYYDAFTNWHAPTSTLIYTTIGSELTVGEGYRAGAGIAGEFSWFTPTAARGFIGSNETIGGRASYGQELAIFPGSTFQQTMNYHNIGMDFLVGGASLYFNDNFEVTGAGVSFGPSFPLGTSVAISGPTVPTPSFKFNTPGATIPTNPAGVPKSGGLNFSGNAAVEIQGPKMRDGSFLSGVKE